MYLVFSIFVGSILGILIGQINTRKRLKDDFEKMLINFIDTFDFFKKYLDKDLELADIYDEIKENEKVFKLAKLNDSVYVKINILNSAMPAFNTRQLRVFLLSAGDCILGIEDRLKEKFAFEYDNETDIYKEFLVNLRELRRICMCHN